LTRKRGSTSQTFRGRSRRLEQTPFLEVCDFPRGSCRVVSQVEMGPISCAWLWAFLREIADCENHRLRQPAEFGLELSGLEADIEETSPVWGRITHSCL